MWLFHCRCVAFGRAINMQSLGQALLLEKTSKYFYLRIQGSNKAVHHHHHADFFFWDLYLHYLLHYLIELIFKKNVKNTISKRNVILIYIKFNRWKVIWREIQINLLTRTLSYFMKKWSDSTRRYWTAHLRISRRWWQWWSMASAHFPTQSYGGTTIVRYSLPARQD